MAQNGPKKVHNDMRGLSREIKSRNEEKKKPKISQENDIKNGY